MRWVLNGMVRSIKYQDEKNNKNVRTGSHKALEAVVSLFGGS